MRSCEIGPRGSWRPLPRRRRNGPGKHSKTVRGKPSPPVSLPRRPWAQRKRVELLAASGGRLRAALEAAHVGQRFATGRPFSRSGDQRRLGVTAFLQHGRLVPGDIAIEDGHVVALGLTPGNRGIAIPGLVDLQVNGYAGVDMLSASVEELAAVSRALARDGVLAFQPTLISSETARTKTAAGHIADLSRREQDGARILGIHLEGPFLSPLRAGTHPAERLARPDLEHLRSLL